MRCSTISFTRYYGAAGGPLKQLYLRIEDIYSDPANYPEEVQDEAERAVSPDRGDRLEIFGHGSADGGTRLADGRSRPAHRREVEKQRAALFRKAVWDYMVEGRKMYLAKQHAK